ncbi:hypothetical protein T439DRAFT_325940 [Meredithblackwellia eburnea MCA 4105]
MDTVTQLVLSWTTLPKDQLQDSQIPNQLASKLEAQEIKLIQLVKALADSLTSEDDNTRSTGVQLLSLTVQATIKSSLDRQTTKTLVTFFTDKLGDNASMLYCVLALQSLVQSPTFGVGEGEEVARGLLSSITLSSHPQSTRYQIFTLLSTLLTDARPALLRLGPTFVKGYCDLVEGEKDPRNLMVSFGIVREILVGFEVDEFIANLFDITFCYFPITFVPPPDDPYGITSDELILALRECLAANSLLGPLALGLFLEKMQASSEKSKKQTLQALISCFPVYGGKVSGEWAPRFSEALLIEVFHATSDEMQDLALDCFQSLMATLYPDSPSPSPSSNETNEMDVDTPPTSVSNSKEIKGVAVKVVKNSLDELQEPDKSNAKPATRVLVALMGASNRLADYIISLTLPQLWTIYKNPDEVALRPSILLHLSTLLSSLSTPPARCPLSPPATYPTPTLTHADGKSPLEPVRDDLLSLLTSATRDPSTRIAGLASLVALIKVPSFLTPAEVAFGVSAINDVLSVADPGSNEDEYEAALEGLVGLAPLHPKQVEGSTLPLLFAKLPPSGKGVRKGSKEDAGYRRALEALAELCLHPSLFEILMLRVLARLEGVLEEEQEEGEREGRQTIYAHHLLATLISVLAVKTERGDDDLPKYLDKFVPRLCAAFLVPTTVEGGERRVVAMDERLLADAGKVLNKIVQRVDVERQSTFSYAMNAAFHEGKLDKLLGEQAKDVGTVNFSPLNPKASTTQQNTIVLFSAAILAMRPTTAVSASDLTGFLRHFLVRSTEVGNETQLVATVNLLGQTVNKRAQDLSEFLTKDVAEYWDSSVVGGKTDRVRRAALRSWAWIAKGLVVRSDQRGYDAVEKILQLFHDPVLGREAASTLGVIADEGDRIMSKENFAVIRLLYKQRFFAFLLPKLVQGHKSALGEDQLVYLVALSSVLVHIPKQIAITELPKLMPLLVTALDLPDANLRANVIDTLGVLAKEVSSQLELSVGNIALKVLRDVVENATVQGAVKLRLSSLAFLGLLPATVPYSTLHPHKATILRQLGQAIDDPRRDVRRAAVDCRSKWFLYSS